MQYDAVDNTLVKWYQGSQPQTMSYDPASRIATSTSGSTVTTFLHDGAGNLILQSQVGALTTYHYDSENRNTAILYPGGTLSTYTYQGYNGLRRTNQEAGDPVYTTVWDNLGNYLGEIQ